MNLRNRCEPAKHGAKYLGSETVRLRAEQYTALQYTNLFWSKTHQPEMELGRSRRISNNKTLPGVWAKIGMKWIPTLAENVEYPEGDRHDDLDAEWRL